MAKRVNGLVTTLIALGSIFILFPLYMAITIALKTPKELADSALSFPFGFHIENFARAIETTNFFVAMKNSVVITVFVLVFTILTNSMVAYAIARNLHKKFFKMVYYYFIAALFIPFPIIMLPIDKQTSALSMNNPLGLIFLYVVYGIAFNTFIYVGYIRSIPKELEEAAIMDGCKYMGGILEGCLPAAGPNQRNGWNIDMFMGLERFYAAAYYFR